MNNQARPIVKIRSAAFEEIMKRDERKRMKIFTRSRKKPRFALFSEESSESEINDTNETVAQRENLVSRIFRKKGNSKEKFTEEEEEEKEEEEEPISSIIDVKNIVNETVMQGNNKDLIFFPSDSNDTSDKSYHQEEDNILMELNEAANNVIPTSNYAKTKAKKSKRRNRFWNFFRASEAQDEISLSMGSNDTSKIIDLNSTSVSISDAEDEIDEVLSAKTTKVSDTAKIVKVSSESRSSNSSTRNISTFQKYRKKLVTTASIVLCLFLAAPAPKRFTASTQNSDESYLPTKSTRTNPDFFNNLAPPNDETNQKSSPSFSETPPTTALSSLLPPLSSPPQKTSPSTARFSASTFVSEAVRKVGPSVVRIDTESYSSAQTSASPFHLFDEDQDESNEEKNNVIKSGQGSGIIFSNDGLVLTNAHVVENVHRVYVTLTDGRKFVAEVKGADEMVDIAVLQILSHSPWGGYSPWGGNNAPSDSSNQQSAPQHQHHQHQHHQRIRDTTPKEPLPVADLGNSDTLQVGEFVIAVGNPAGLDNSVTMGIISSLKRSSEEIGLPGKKVTFIQTDAAVNPGNSGGPLVNEYGEIIGINTCIRANMEGIAFAIPINKAKEIMYQLAEGQNIKHGYIGVVMMTITPDFARQNNIDPNSPVGIIPEVKGVMIERVLSNTPAAMAGLRRFDVMLEINGVPIASAAEAAEIVDAASIEQVMELKVLRGGKLINIDVTPADLAEKMRIRKELKEKRERQQQREGGGFQGEMPGGRIYVLPFPAP